MGTRAIVQVVGCSRAVPDKPGAYTGACRLYRHTDGDPGSCMRAIARSIEMMERLAEENVLWQSRQLRHIAVAPMAQAIVAWAMSSNCVPVVLERNCAGVPKLAHLGDQSDLEWLYVVDCNARLVNLYSTKQARPEDCPDGKNSGTPTEHLEAGFFVDAERVFRRELVPEAVEAALGDVDEGLGLLGAKGWRFNEMPDPYLRLVQQAARKNQLPLSPAPSVELEATTDPLSLAAAYCI